MHITDRLYEKKWGVFNHYASHIFKAREGRAWSELVDRLDVRKIADALHEMGAGYYFITLTHGTKHMLAPNAAYDALLGAEPGENCAERDVILDLYDALSAYGIDLYLYFNASGPVSDRAVAEKLGYWYNDNEIWTPRKGMVPYNWRDAVVLEDGVELDFIERWSGVLREYSLRYGKRISGWWIDSCYSFTGFNQTNIRYFYDAAKAGNPNALVACNNGVKPEVRRWYRNEEFTAGEFNELEYVPSGRFTDGAQSHILAPMGNTWWHPAARYDNAYMRDYIERVNRAGGVVTVDIHVNADGSFVKEQQEALTL